ncbi:hypothetical protein MUP77_24595 [Candidatus Bathyarchaeota archaeon]|nr:hypothetical protein [Candidatus Bathyarchaeota archaeon]
MVKKICPKCGFEKVAERVMEFCPNDGTRLQQKPQPIRSVSKAGQRPDPLFERRIVIKPLELLNSSKWFDDDKQYAFQDSYEEAQKFNWNRIANLSLEEIRTDVIGFLNECRAFGPIIIEPTNEMASSIKQAYIDTEDHLAALHEINIEDVHLQETSRILENADRLLYRFSNIGLMFREVAASKLLHMLIPEFFVMWDNTIMVAYGVDKYHYGSDFLSLMNQKINQSIDLAMQEWKCSRESAIQRLRYRGKTLAKIIDEYNFREYTRMRKHLSRGIRFR